VKDNAKDGGVPIMDPTRTLNPTVDAPSIRYRGVWKATWFWPALT